MGMMVFKCGSVGKTSLKALLGVAGGITLAVCFAVNVSADESLSCYKGDKENPIYVGEIAGANFTDAADECNSFYGDCNGECFGCYMDEDSTKEICVDNQGKKFTR